jgi:Lactate dehydrogenase and related dehydrogenases
MKIVLTDAQTVLDDIVNADVLNRFGEVESFGLLKYEEVAEKIADADIVVCNKTLLDSHTMRLAKNLKYIGLFATGYNNIDLDYCNQKRHNRLQRRFIFNKCGCTAHICTHS